MKAKKSKASDLDKKWKEINSLWGEAIMAPIETGRLLLQAKADLSEKEFNSMIEEDLPFNKAQAQRMMNRARRFDIRLEIEKGKSR